MQPIVINTHLHQLKHWFIVYTHELPPPAASGIFYVGCCRFEELLQFPDARRNSEWRKIAKDKRAQQIILKTINVVETQQAAEALQKATAMALNAYCNKVGQVMTGPNSPIKCMNDGELFDSIAEAARHYQIPATSISNHLAGREGYRHVKTYRFERV